MVNMTLGASIVLDEIGLALKTSYSWCGTMTMLLHDAVNKAATIKSTLWVKLLNTI